MEFMEIIKMVAYLVWTIVGITIIVSTIYYMNVMKPLMKVYKNMIDENGDLFGGDEA